MRQYKWACGQSYKQFTLVNYDSRVVLTSKLHYYDSRAVIYERKLLYKIGHWFTTYCSCQTAC